MEKPCLAVYVCVAKLKTIEVGEYLVSTQKNEADLMVILGLRVFKNSLSFIFKKVEIILPHLASGIVILVKILLSFDGALINIFF